MLRPRRPGRTKAVRPSTLPPPRRQSMPTDTAFKTYGARLKAIVWEELAPASATTAAALDDLEPTQEEIPCGTDGASCAHPCCS